MYKILFPTLNIVQYKKLVDHQAYLDIKPLKDEEYSQELKKLTGGKEWFTEQSPFYTAISTGVYICNNVNIPCIVTNIQ